MNRKARVLFLVATPIPIGLAAVVVLYLLASPEVCPSIDCAASFRSGAVDVFGAGNFTLAQSIVLAGGILVAAWLLASGVLSWRRWLSAGVATLLLTLVIAWSLPSLPVAPAPTVACTTPGAGGLPVLGRCITGLAPVDSRFGLRLLVIATGIGAAVGAAVRDASLRRSRRVWPKTDPKSPGRGIVQRFVRR